MNDQYLSTVRLMLAIAPDVFDTPHFAMKGGTAINMFVQDLPRLSVDIDVVSVHMSRAATTLLQSSMTNSLARDRPSSDRDTWLPWRPPVAETKATT